MKMGEVDFIVSTGCVMRNRRCLGSPPKTGAEYMTE